MHFSPFLSLYMYLLRADRLKVGYSPLSNTLWTKIPGALKSEPKKLHELVESIQCRHIELKQL